MSFEVPTTLPFLRDHGAFIIRLGVAGKTNRNLDATLGGFVKQLFGREIPDVRGSVAVAFKTSDSHVDEGLGSVGKFE